MRSSTQKHMRLPDLGEGLTEATIVRWLVGVGDVVAEDQIVAEVETAKATVELPAPFAGTVAEMHAGEGDEVAVGTVMLSLGSDDADVASSARVDGGVARSPDDDGGGGGVAASPDDDGSRLLVGFGVSSGRGRRRRSRGSRQAPGAHTGRPRAKPPVRKLAKDLGVDLADVVGSGPDGRITRDDVRAASDAHDAVALRPPAGDQDAMGERAPTAAHAPPETVAPQRIPVTGVRARIADHLSLAWREIPAAACWIECDATELLTVRAALAEAQPASKVTPLALILRCCVVALQQVPRLNASFDAEARQIVQHAGIHLGVATQTERGLVVPVVRDAGARSVVDLAHAVRDLATRARDSILAPAQMVGSTFTVSNFGAFGVDGGTPIINHPEAAILGVGRITPRPWVVDQRVEVREIVQLSLTFDHRVCDGAEAAGFLRRLADLVEQPMLLLAH